MTRFENRVVQSLLVVLILLPTYVTSFGQSDDEMNQLNEAYRNYRELNEAGEHVESLAFARDALELANTIFNVENETTAALSHNYGLNLLATDQHEEATVELERTIGRYRTVYGEGSEILASVLFDAGIAYLMQRDEENNSESKALSSFRDSLEIISMHYGTDSIEYAEVSQRAGTTFLDLVEILEASTRRRFIAGTAAVLGSVTKQEQIDDQPNVQAGAYLIRSGFEYRKEAERLRELGNEFIVDTVEVLSNVGTDQALQQLMTVHGYLVRIYEDSGESELATEQLLLMSQAVPPAEDADPVPVYLRAAEYPVEAARMGNEGWARLEFTIDESGYVRNPIAVDSSNDVFEKPSLEVITGFRFAPFVEDNDPVSKDGVQYTFRFELD